MTMDVSETKLDGNAIGGLLREIFTMEMTTADTTCAGCGTVNAVGRVACSPGTHGQGSGSARQKAARGAAVRADGTPAGHHGCRAAGVVPRRAAARRRQAPDTRPDCRRARAPRRGRVDADEVAPGD